MLGQHPQLYGVPEFHLLRYETVGEFLQGCSQAMFSMADGALRTIAQTVFGEQSVATIQRADLVVEAAIGLDERVSCRDNCGRRFPAAPGGEESEYRI